MIYQLKEVTLPWMISMCSASHKATSSQSASSVYARLPFHSHYWYLQADSGLCNRVVVQTGRHISCLGNIVSKNVMLLNVHICERAVCLWQKIMPMSFSVNSVITVMCNKITKKNQAFAKLFKWPSSSRHTCLRKAAQDPPRR